ncbi:MAG: TetR/AcrR family transcriptional regulator [Anaerolineae bacterium]|nr:TetR/AcrR family transcriptional regulator [Anaerolineae bacterium]
MSQPVKNLRLRRTQKLLREALVELIEERNFDALTVGEITERALVSRAAFYRNYQDKFDLVEQIFAEAMQALFDAVSQPGTEHPPEIWVRFFEHIAEYERLYRALLGRKGSPWFVLKMRARMIDLVKGFQRLSLGQPAANPPTYPDSDEFTANLVATMLVEAVTWWLEQGRLYSSEEMTRRCALLVTAIFKETNTWQ